MYFCYELYVKVSFNWLWNKSSGIQVCFSNTKIILKMSVFLHLRFISCINSGFFFFYIYFTFIFMAEDIKHNVFLYI